MNAIDKLVDELRMNPKRFHATGGYERLLEALRRLGGKEAVTKVALDLGYDSPSAFITMFKKALGCTPGQYFKLVD